MSHSAHYCNKRCMFCKQAHELVSATLPQLPRLGQPANCDWVGPYRAATVSRTFHGRRVHLCIHGERQWPDDYITSVKATEMKRRESSPRWRCGRCDGRGFVRPGVECDEPRTKGHSKMMRLNPGEKQGWWSAKKFDRRIRMRALVQRRVNDKRTRILLDTGANVSVITDTFAKKLRLRDDKRRQGVTTRRAQVKITLGWEMVYEFEMWVMAHSGR
ncbi:Aspartic peptidase domain [Phytophthora cactorum]|nr:Aspartic peptidase domain [Phytophthora cactorum]